MRRSNKKKYTKFGPKYRWELRKQLSIESPAPGRCEICGAEERLLKRQLCIDHNHETDIVRGLLCGSCNMGLGHFRDSLKLLQAAQEYLQRTDPGYPGFESIVRERTGYLELSDLQNKEIYFNTELIQKRIEDLYRSPI